MTISPSPATVAVGATVQLTSAPGAKWSSNNSMIASVSNTGLVSGRSLGSTVIVAKKGNQRATATVTVQQAVPAPTPEPVPTPPAPEPAPAPMPAPLPPPSGNEVYITASDNAQAIIDKCPAGTVYVFVDAQMPPGFQGLVPKQGDVYRGTVSGANRAVYLFGQSASAPGVHLYQLTVQDFASPLQHGASEPSGASWLIEDAIFQRNASIGARIAHQMTMRRCKFLENGQMGVGGGGDDVVIDNCESAFNNTSRVDPGWEAGGSKFARTRRLKIINGSKAHHNLGPGWWLDIDNSDFTLDDWIAEDNYSGGFNASSAGAFIEISAGGAIRNGQSRRNGLDFKGWDGAWGAGILIAASGGTGLIIEFNRVEDNAGGVALVQQARFADPPYNTKPYILQNVHVRENDIQMPEGITGAVQDIGSDAIFDSRNVTFSANRYRVRGNTMKYAWKNATRDWSAWRAYGQDASGTCTVY